MNISRREALKGLVQGAVVIPTISRPEILPNGASCDCELFFPEMYGAVGNGTTDDTEAIQDAIDAASVAGGIVVLSRTYRITSQGIHDFQQYANCNYALLVEADNVRIWGPGSLVLTEKPTATYGAFVALAVGNGDDAIVNVGVRGVTVDASALSESDREDLSDAGVGCAIGFFNCSNFYCYDCVVEYGWGYNAAIQAHILSEYGYIVANRVNHSVKGGIWVDGLQYGTIADNAIYDVGVHGIFASVNGDNDRSSCNLSIIGNRIETVGQLGIGITGARHIVSDNLIETDTGVGALRLVGISDYPCENNLVKGNLLRWSTTASRAALYLVGVSDGLVKDNFLQGNLACGFIYGCSIDQYSQDNVVVNNMFDVTAGSPVYVFSGPGISGNVITPNY